MVISVIKSVVEISFSKHIFDELSFSILYLYLHTKQKALTSSGHKSQLESHSEVKVLFRVILKYVNLPAYWLVSNESLSSAPSFISG